MKKILSWLIVSSNDPSKISATIKGVGLMLIPIIAAIVVTVTGVDIPQSSWIELLDGVISFAGAALALFGISRKIYLSFKK